jgi:hypothetical protein
MMMKPTLKAILSLFIIFQLTIMIVMANGGSYLGRKFQFLLPYANAIGLNTTWNFFSPDPAHTMYFHSLVYFENEYGEMIKDPVEEFYPPEKEKVVIDGTKRRFLYAMRFMMLDPERVETLLGPWLCKSNPGSTSVLIEQTIESIPPLDRAEIGEWSQEPRTTKWNLKCKT